MDSHIVYFATEQEEKELDEKMVQLRAEAKARHAAKKAADQQAAQAPEPPEEERSNP